MTEKTLEHAKIREALGRGIPHKGTFLHSTPCPNCGAYGLHWMAEKEFWCDSCWHIIVVSQATYKTDDDGLRKKP